MKPLCSLHTHSRLCDGEADLAEMAAAAYGAGLRAFGASGHAHTPLPWDRGGVLDADMAPYRTEVLRLREAYAGRMDVLLGLEWDSCADVSWAGFDYWIGSVHNLPGPEGGACCVDWSAERLAEGCRAQFAGDFRALTERFYDDEAKMAALRPPILGHFDLVTKFNGGGNAFFDEDAPWYRRAALDALRAADVSATVLEINTGAVFRKYRRAPYPAPFLLRAWREMGGRVVLTADAHCAEAIAFGYGPAAAAARDAGFREQAVLTRAGWGMAGL